MNGIDPNALPPALPPQNVAANPGAVAGHEMPLPASEASESARQLGSIGMSEVVGGYDEDRGNYFQHRTVRGQDPEGKPIYGYRELTGQELNDVTVQHAKVRLDAANRVERPADLPAPGTESAPQAAAAEAAQPQNTSENASAATQPVDPAFVGRQTDPYRQPEATSPRTLKDLETAAREAGIEVDEAGAAPAGATSSRFADRNISSSPAATPSPSQQPAPEAPIPQPPQAEDWTPGGNPGKNLERRRRNSIPE